jgi:hypothetical protein
MPCPFISPPTPTPPSQLVDAVMADAYIPRLLKVPPPYIPRPPHIPVHPPTSRDAYIPRLLKVPPLLPSSVSRRGSGAMQVLRRRVKACAAARTPCVR